MARIVALLGLVVLLAPLGHCWHSEEMELFDLVEEINENFYEVLGISQDADLSEVKKAYRRLSRVIHPDKSDAPDAEVKFRQLVGIYDVLRDEGRRKRYDRVLVEGLPDWRDPIYYYRRARKMSMVEISIILTVVISITQYLMAWGTYIDRKHTVEENLIRRFKIKDKKKKRAEDQQNYKKIEEELTLIPRPSLWNILPVQLVMLVVSIPRLVKEVFTTIKKEQERKLKEKAEQEEEEKRLKEEEERRKEKKASRKEGRKRVNIYPEYSGECILDSVDGPEEGVVRRPRIKPEPSNIPVILGGPWSEDEFSDLARFMAKYPGGTVNRWERIADKMGRTVYEVTKMSVKVKDRLAQKFSDTKDEATTEVKVKVKTRGENADLTAGSDEKWSPVQQKALEKALKLYPKGTDQRWDRIANAVPEKSKEDCMMRFRYLAEMIRKKREEAEKQNEEQQVCEEETQDETKRANDEDNISDTNTKENSVAGDDDEVSTEEESASDDEEEEEADDEGEEEEEVDSDDYDDDDEEGEDDDDQDKDSDLTDSDIDDVKKH